MVGVEVPDAQEAEESICASTPPPMWVSEVTGRVRPTFAKLGGLAQSVEVQTHCAPHQGHRLRVLCPGWLAREKFTQCYVENAPSTTL